MARKCKNKGCSEGLLPARQCTTFLAKKGFCSDRCAADWGLEKARKVRERTIKKEVREYREKSKTLAQVVSDAQTWVNRVVVAEDKRKGCISCDNPVATDAGHYFHKGMKYRTSPLTLDRRNLNGQCEACNRYKGGGNQHEYRLGYIARYGQAAFDDLCEFKAAVDRGDVPSLTREEAKDARGKGEAEGIESQRLTLLVVVYIVIDILRQTGERNECNTVHNRAV